MSEQKQTLDDLAKAGWKEPPPPAAMPKAGNGDPAGFAPVRAALDDYDQKFRQTTAGKVDTWMNTPLGHPTGNDTVDEMTSPSNLAQAALIGAKPAAHLALKAVSGLLGAVAPEVAADIVGLLSPRAAHAIRIAQAVARPSAAPAAPAAEPPPSPSVPANATGTSMVPAPMPTGGMDLAAQRAAFQARAAARQTPAATAPAPAGATPAPPVTVAPVEPPVAAPAPASPVAAVPQAAAPAPTKTGTLLYHQSPNVLIGNKPNFDAFYGDATFLKDFPDEFGAHTYQVELPSSAKVLDLNKSTKAAREFMAKVAEAAYPDDAGFAAELRAGVKSAREDFYETWTDKSHVMEALKKTPGYSAVKYQSEYVLPKETSDLLSGAKVSSTGSALEPTSPKAASPTEPPIVPRGTPPATVMSPTRAGSELAIEAIRAKIKLAPDEYPPLIKAVMGGMDPKQAISAVVAQRADPVAAMAQMPGVMSPAQVTAEIAARVGNRSPKR